MQVATKNGMMGQRQLTNGWANNPVWGHNGRKGRDGRGMSG